MRACGTGDDETRNSEFETQDSNVESRKELTTKDTEKHREDAESTMGASKSATRIACPAG
jgi:hypothetical protein